MSRADNRMRNFASQGVTLHGAKSALLLAAATAVVIATTAFGPGARVSGAEMTPSYDSVAAIQASLDAELGSVRMLIGHPGLDMEKAFSKLGNGDLQIMFRGTNQMPSMSEYFRGATGVFDMGEVRQEHYESFMLYRQVASAFSDAYPDDNARTAFAAFAALRDGAPIELLEMMAAKSELDALTGVDNSISHTILQHVMAVANEKVRDTLPRFSLMQVNDLSEQFSRTSRLPVIPDGFGEIMHLVMEQDTFFIPVQEGAVAGSLDAWLKSASDIPEIARIRDLHTFLYDRNTVGMDYSRFDADPDQTIRGVAKLAMAGDFVARELAPLVGLAQDFRYSPISQVSDLPSADEIHGEPIIFNRDDLYVYTDKGNRAMFAVTRAHDLVFIATPEGMHKTYYEQSGHDASPIDQIAMKR